MAIRRWEMLLSAQADSYLLKIQGDRTDVDRIVQAHAAVCQNVQEISEDTFQWAIFVVGATLAEKLAIQNQVMSLTTDAEGKKPSDSLLDVIEGLSGALQDLTNLTEDEQAYVMNKMARMGQTSAPSSIGATPAPAAGTAATVRPPAGFPTTRGPAVGGGMAPPIAPGGISPGPAQPIAPVPGFTPGRVAPQQIPGRVAPGTPLPPVSIPGGFPGSPGKPVGVPATSAPLPTPGIVRPAQPPKSFGPAVPQTPLPPVSLPKVTFPGVPTSPKSAPVPMPTPPSPVAPPAAPPPPKVEVSAPIAEPPTINPAPPAKLPTVEIPAEKPKVSPPPAVAVPPSSTELVIEKRVEPLAARTEPPVAMPKAPVPEEPKVDSAAPLTPDSSPFKEIKPASTPPLSAGAATKTDDGQIQAAIFYPPEGDEWKTHFLNTLSDIALKKSKKPTHFKINASVSGPISLENSAEWIWKSKTSGADIFFVVLPPELGSDLMEPVVAEAESAGLRCFLVPQSEIQSRLLYMDLMVELMMFKKRIRPPVP